MGCSKKSRVNHIVFAALKLKDYNLAITVCYQTSFQDFEKLLGFSSSTGSSTSSVWWFRRRRKVCTCGWQFFWRGGFAERSMSSGWRNLGVRTRKFQEAYHFFLPLSTLLTNRLETTARSAFCFCTCAVRRTSFVFSQMLWTKRQRWTNLQAYLRLNLSTLKEVEGSRKTVNSIT